MLVFKIFKIYEYRVDFNTDRTSIITCILKKQER